MKIGVFSDIHLNKFTEFGGPDGRRRLEDGIRVLWQVFDIFRKEHCEVVVFCGDFFHTRRSIDIDTFNTVRKSLLELPLGSFKKLFALTGNHDWYDNACSTSGIEFLSDYGFKVFTRVDRVIYKNTALFFMPWSPAGAVYQDFHKPKDAKVDNMLLFVHTIPKGSKVGIHTFNNGDKLHRFEDMFDCIFCGDIHQRQYLGKSIVVCGAPMHHNFGDFDVRGVHIYDTEKHEVYFRPTDYPRFFVIDDVESINDRDYFRLTTYKDVDIDQDNVSVIRLKSGVERKNIEIDVTYSPQAAVIAYANKYGKYNVSRLIDIGLGVLP